MPLMPHNVIMYHSLRVNGIDRRDFPKGKVIASVGLGYQALGRSEKENIRIPRDASDHSHHELWRTCHVAQLPTPVVVENGEEAYILYSGGTL
jgi:hypothetical protein